MNLAGPKMIPFVRYHDCRSAMKWLEKAFGFEEQYLVAAEGEAVAHAQMVIPGGMIMLGSTAPSGAQPAATDLDDVVAGVYVIVKEIDLHYERAREAGARILRPLADTAFGSRDYVAADPEGHVWSFGTYDPYAPAQG